MKRLRSVLHVDKQLLLQFSLAFAAFFSMVLISIVFGSRIVSRYVASYGNEVLNSSVETLNAYLHESQLTLEDISLSVERLKNEDAGNVSIRDEIVLWTNWMKKQNERFDSFNGVYGFVDGEFIDGTFWEPPDSYVPESRPWYIGAVERKGDVYYADPYIDAQTGNYVLTVSKLMYDKSDKAFGVIAIDVFITGISNFVDELQLLNSGYGILLDTNQAIVVHPEKTYIGMHLKDVDKGAGGHAEISKLLSSGQAVSRFSLTNYKGVKSVSFFRELSNGWYVGIVSPNKAYYGDVITMVIFLSIVGFVLMVLLCIVLAYLNRQKQRSEEANKVKSDFLANMSHEIRTPMNAIIGMTDLLLNESLSERQEGYVNDIKTSSHSLLSIINDILDLSKIESGKLELAPIDYDFQLLIDNVRSMFKFVAKKKDLEFLFESEGDLPKCLHGDDIKLRQVLTNICGNSVKFTEKGYILLKITVKEKSIQFEIRDTGMGIRKEDIPKLFDPFSQADAQKNRNIVGTGLGLPISKTFVEMMGGKITVDSVYGEGTTFTVTIPKVEGNEESIQYEEKAKKEKTFVAPDAKILVVDDNEVNLKVASGLLYLHEIKADTALSGKEALEAIQKTDYDILFMDHMMPEMDGVEATRLIREMGKSYKELTIIALTANAIRGAKEMFLAHQFNGFLSKPIEVDKLKETLEEFLPPDKIKERNVPLSDNEADNAFIESVNHVNGVNTEIGLSRVSGMVEMYRTTLELFHKKLLSDCEKMDRCLDNRDLHNLAITVHGIKSSLSTIGAMNLSEAAYDLEMAAKKEDLPFCGQNLPAFLVNLCALHEELSVIFPKKESSSRPEGDPELMRKAVGEAKTAAEEFDTDQGLEALQKLSEYDFGETNNRLLEDAREAFRDFDFDAAAERLMNIDEGSL